MWLAALLLGLVVGGSVTPSVHAVEEDARLTVTITAVSPRLTSGQPLVVAGTVRNDDDAAWSDTRVQASIAPRPFTDRAELVDELENDPDATGSPVADPAATSEIGNLAPGQTASFSITVPWDRLDITGGPGVYPVGVELVGDELSLGKAATLVPLTSDGLPSVPSALMVTLAAPVRLAGAATPADPRELVDAVSPDGPLGRSLDLVKTLPRGAAGIVLDPYLLDLVGALADDEAFARDHPQDHEQLVAFDDRLRSTITALPTLTTGYGLPDLTALSAATGTASLRTITDTVTRRALDDHGLSVPSVRWIEDGGMSGALLSALGTDQPYIANADDLADWRPSDGSFTLVGGAPTLLRHDLTAALPGAVTAVTLRQLLLAEADLAARGRADDPASRADALVITAPGWDPGAHWREADLAAAWTLADLTSGLPDLGVVPVPEETLSPPDSAPVSTVVVDEVRRLGSVVDKLASISVDDEAVAADHALIVDLLGVAWRDRPDDAVAAAADRRTAIESELRQPAIEGPPSFLLAGRHGQVPLTIHNPTSQTIRVGVSVSSTNPQLRVDDLSDVEVPAGARTTVTVPIDVGRQNTTSLTTQLVTPEGLPFGQAARFNVRSSNTGMVVWIVMGVASGLLALAVARRLWQRFKHSDVPGGDEDSESVGKETAAPTAPQTTREVGRASAWMALGTLVSRATGFLRDLLLIWVIGTGLNGDLFNSANTVPNALYILVAGGVFNVVLVPQLVRAMKQDSDGGAAYAHRIMTLGLLVLGTATVVLVAAAPVLVRVVFDGALFTETFADQRQSALWLMYLCVPQVFFYGAFLLVGQVLNARGRFGPMMWAPILNNIVAGSTLIAYMVVFGRSGGNDGFTFDEALLLGLGSTFGIAAQAAVLVPCLRATGFRYRPRFDFRGVGLGHTLRLGGWTLAFVIVNQITFITVNRLATSGSLDGASAGEGGAGSTVYNFGFLISQLPHGVITVSLVTAIMPTLASLAIDRRPDLLGEELRRTLRTALALIMPLAVAAACLATPAATAIALGTTPGQAEAIGTTVVAFAPSMVLFCLHFVMLRGFYAAEDTRTPFFLQLVVAATNLAAAMAFTRDADPHQVASRLAWAWSTAYLVGSLAALWLQSRRCGTIIDRPTLGFLVRLTAACAATAAALRGAATLLDAVGLDGETPLGALAVLALAGAVGAATLLIAARVVRLTEVTRVTTLLRRRASRMSPTE
ncbi:MAG: murein biosynthesis integral membrane protein MurJ [Aeromicrobium sp.]|uniref:murein biosynthesis integral membrane protein MurJ n=1 Tax=Aeromicrobium sp. TaxID=1871063 RepID=UPI0039E6B396